MVYFYGTKPEERYFIKYQEQHCKCSKWRDSVTKYTWLNVAFFFFLVIWERKLARKTNMYFLCLFSKGNMNWDNLIPMISTCLFEETHGKKESNNLTWWLKKKNKKKQICGLYKQMNAVIHSQCKSPRYQNVVLGTKQLLCICKMFFMPSNWWTQIINLAV